MRQGDVYWADVGEASGIRPVVILTRTNIIARLNSITIAPVTATIRGIDTEVLIHLRSVSK
jgi:mRNA-degrading endonuclease toxin of MazEF toxin-antitoxin module